MASRSDTISAERVNSDRTVETQPNFEGGIDVNGANAAIAQNCVYVAKNLNLTHQGRLEKRSGFVTVDTPDELKAFEKAHPELGKITGHIQGKTQSYVRFLDDSGNWLEF